MKRYFLTYFMLSMSAVMLLTTSCKDDDHEEPVTIELSDATINFLATELAEKSIEITTNAPKWEYHNTADWLNVEQRSDLLVVMPKDENTLLSKRTTTIVISATGAESQELIVTQFGSEIEVTATEIIEFAAAGEVKDFVIVTNCFTQDEYTGELERWKELDLNIIENQWWEATFDFDRTKHENGVTTITVLVTAEQNNYIDQRSEIITYYLYDPAAQFEVELVQYGAELEVNAPENIEFIAEGETKDYVITTNCFTQEEYVKKLERWKALDLNNVENQWWEANFDFDRTKHEDGITTITVLVTAGENPNTDSRNTVVSYYLYNDVDEFSVELIQAGAEMSSFIWDRPMVQYMNLLEGVSKVDYHGSITRDEEMKDLVFNDNGMLVSYEHITTGLDFIAMNISYDSQNRITQITGKGGNFDPRDFVIKFTYGDHGQYIHIEEFLMELYNAFPFSGWSWMPLLMKDITKIELKDNLSPDSPYTNLTLSYTISGDKTTGSVSLSIPAYGEQADYQKFKFENGFVKEVEFEMPWVGTTTAKYEINYETGAIIKHTKIDRWGDIVILFNQDRLNTIKELQSSDMPAVYEYNDNLDVVKYNDKTYTYEYDSKGNWIKRTSSVAGEEPIERNITYK